MTILTHLHVDAPAEDMLAEIEENGAVVIEGFLSKEVLDRFNREIDPHLTGKANNHGHPNPAVEFFHGAQTKHLTGIAGVSDAFVNDVLLHPIYKAVGDHFLLPYCADYQLNLGHVLQRGPGAGDQTIHRDQDVWPRALNGVIKHRQFASLLALSEYTAEMGATRIVPGSHKWDEDRKPKPEEIAIAEMSPGSAAIYLGSTLHAAGPNSTQKPRRGMHTSFCLGWLRTEENNYLAISTERACQMPRRAQELLGFGLHDAVERGEGFLGALDNRNPIDVLAERMAA